MTIRGIAVGIAVLLCLNKGQLSAGEFSEQIRTLLAAHVESHVQTQLNDVEISECEFVNRPIKVMGRRVASFREKRSFSLRPDSSSFRLKIHGLDINNGRISLEVECSCDIAGQAHYSTANAAIPVSLTSEVTMRVSATAKLEADISVTGSKLTLSKLSLDDLDVSLSEVRWTHPQIDALWDWISPSIVEALMNQQSTAILKANRALNEPIPMVFSVDTLIGFMK